MITKSACPFHLPLWGSSLLLLLLVIRLLVTQPNYLYSVEVLMLLLRGISHGHVYNTTR